MTFRVTAHERADILGHRGVVVWLNRPSAVVWITDLFGSGKYTLGCALERRLGHGGHAVVVLDGGHGLRRLRLHSPRP